MASPDYSALVPALVFTDGSGGTGGTPYNAATWTSVRNELITYIENHQNGAANHHGSMDVLDYNSGSGTPYQLNETTAYANTATSVGGAVTQWARNDMFASNDKAIIGSTGTLTTRLAAKGSAWQDLTTLTGLLYGGSPTFGTVTGVAPDSSHLAGLFKGASGDPSAQITLGATNNAGSTYYFYTAAPTTGGSPAPAVVVSNGTFVAYATNNSFAAMQARGSDESVRKVLSLQTHNAVEGGSFNSDGTGTLKSVTLTSNIAYTEVDTTLIAGVAGTSLVAADSSSHTLKINQNNTGWIGLAGSAAAAGAGTAAGGAVQYTTGSGVFAADTELFWDHTDKRLAVGFSTTPTPISALDVNGAQVFRAMVLPGISTSSPDDAILAYDAATHQLKLSQNGGAYSPLVQQTISGTQNLQSTTSSVQITGQTGVFVHGTLTVDSGTISSQGPLAALVTYDRAGSPGNYTMMYRDATNTYLYSAESGSIFQINNTTGGLGLKNAFFNAPSTGVTPLTALTIAGQTADAAVIDASNTAAGGVKQRWDNYGRPYQTQSVTPTLAMNTAAGSGAGTAPTGASIAGTDYEGTITFTTGGTAPVGANSLVATITLKNALASAMKGVELFPCNTAAGNVFGTNARPFPGSLAAGSWVIASGSAALANTTTYIFGYRLLI